MVGVGGVAPWEDEQLRRELLEVLRCGEADTVVEHEGVVAATDDAPEQMGEPMTDCKRGLPSRLRFIDVADAWDDPRFMGLIELDPNTGSPIVTAQVLTYLLIPRFTGSGVGRY